MSPCRLVGFTGIALVAALLLGAPLARAADPKLDTDDQKIFYTMGYTLKGSLDRFAIRPDELEVLIAGLRDAMEGTPSKVDEQVFAPKIAQLGQTRATQVAEVEKTASAEFLAKEAAAEGATKTPSGLVKRIVKQGSGASPAASDTVKVHYHGTLRDGSVFDSSVDRGEPAEFPLDRVIPCWTEAVQTMKVGEKAHITCPSEIAYGDRGAPPKIKGGAALAFDVELLEIVKAPPASNATPAP
ncbi:MAG: FKBP-type peptidyl-prolyl cis-trans isomerase [Myxococcota bacterium]|jgi:FKBP-type peptidyl-prolyl cis-trans isomerase|nr:FKBP-type peptidyl-prolyl cis-trans isomerase [Myxococcota bacterium]